MTREIIPSLPCNPPQIASSRGLWARWQRRIGYGRVRTTATHPEAYDRPGSTADGKFHHDEMEAAARVCFREALLWLIGQKQFHHDEISGAGNSIMMK